MANPEIESPLDGIDKLTVLLYRLGLSGAALLLLCRGAALLSHGGLLPPAQWLMLLALASAICAFSLHIYDKRIRLILQGSGWAALALLSIGAPDALVLGAALVTLSGLAFKEQFCFAIPGIKLVPLLLPLLWLLEWLQVAWVAALVALVSGALLTLLALAKWRMPLHFDIGDKGRYQI
ncbi:DUF2301 domain-containing membrane protein [Aeromonas jandaei]|uniref:Integral membrane protein n=1 Tax=Aeromonas jandaei TaxID=650 RepID=A0A7T4DQU8_AERJA|nr:DUF2301 domain-containing membrane protein [Aeromonas jandaei]QQB21713.1 hypothetical protein I6H43_09460 [Aeromonas jandaei]UCA32533.1 DUF2301 domain-containing membrane protein [Aeromonas jandaei]